MKYHKFRMGLLAALVLGTAVQSVCAGTVNIWRGTADAADWTESYKWTLHHPPSEGEAAHFREDHSVISVNSTVQLDKGMHLYGEELLLRGNGNVNLWSHFPDDRSVNIPASSSGYANLTLCDNLSLNGRVALSAKNFGTSASKGTITLKDRSVVTGELVIGNEGVGSGRVLVMDNATFRITSMALHTESEKGGMAEIHIMGGTVRIEADSRLFDLFTADPSRKLILGDGGTLRIESSLPVHEKEEKIKALIASKSLVPAPGCRLSPPIFQDEMLIARAEYMHTNIRLRHEEPINAAINHAESSTPDISPENLHDLNALVKTVHEDMNRAGIHEVESVADHPAPAKPDRPRMAGYIVFLGTFLLTLRRPSG